MRKQTIIFGAGGQGRVVLDILRSANICVSGLLNSDPTQKICDVESNKIVAGASAKLIRKIE